MFKVVTLIHFNNLLTITYITVTHDYIVFNKMTKRGDISNYVQLLSCIHNVNWIMAY